MIFFDFLFRTTEWVCAYRRITKSELTSLPKEKFKYEYTVMDTPKGFWAADPFLYEKDGEVFAFFEYTDTKKCKSVLACKRLIPKSNEAPVIIYEFEFHTSYPCIFEYNNELYIVPETSQNKTVEILKCKKWPYKWEKDEKPLIGNICAVDTTRFVKDTKQGFFLYKMKSENDGNRELYFAKTLNNSLQIESIELLKRYDDYNGRPGGNVLSINGESIRVVQPKTNYYGEKIEFYSFGWDENGKYWETKVSEFNKQQIRTNVRYKVIGTHTINRLGDVEIIDMLVSKIDLLKTVKGLFRRLGIFGYGYYEKNAKMISRQS